MRTCTKCLYAYADVDANFYQNDRYSDGYQTWCKRCCCGSSKEARRRRKALDPMLDRKYKLRSKYGLELEDFDQLMEEQGGKCPICQSILDIPMVDHCHGTGRVRGLLCNTCNLLLGHAKDDPEILASAIAYLSE